MASLLKVHAAGRCLTPWCDVQQYDRRLFSQAGLRHHDLYFPDGTCPPDGILAEFLSIAESERGALAIHCKAGLGRTGTLIGCYLMKHYGFTAPEVRQPLCPHAQSPPFSTVSCTHAVLHVHCFQILAHLCGWARRLNAGSVSTLVDQLSEAVRY